MYFRVIKAERIPTAAELYNSSENKKKSCIFWPSRLVYQFSPDEIHGLIGADVLGKLYTGNIKQLKSDLVLVETRAWGDINGKTDAGESTDSTNSVMSLHVNDAKISDLWRLDTLGILDPGEKGTRQELEKAAEEHLTEV
ncbi:integrase catalytic domain-containing protein [Trichonephila inaurata madagascariensis]|uniref:Integrase catalytic domain-containing protein n=1 Tax=Trichonephila inaurata madagascariensis TaxID=2747483 RepID=A0A8X6XYP1_9ARAC|nr:integrase catalytic domain-containing protein [Trichonephila inaurata madagascariensis]